MKKIKLFLLFSVAGLVFSCAENPNPIAITQTSSFGNSPDTNKILSFKKLDINNDNFVSDSEFKKSLRTDFEHLDLNKDSKLAFHEWINDESKENYSKYLQEWVQNEGNPVYQKILNKDEDKKFDKANLVNNIYLENDGINNGNGNIISVEPYVESNDYSSEQTFFTKMNSYLETASKKGMITPKTIVVFPENIGTWLAAANENTSVYSHPTIRGAARRIIIYNFYDFMKSYLFEAKSQDKTKETLIRIKAEKMAAIYSNTFSELAKKFKVTIVAGSIILPGPSIKNDKLSVNRTEQLNNISVIYNPDGKPVDKLVKKVFYTAEEKLFIKSGQSSELPVFDTPAGKLGVLISSDSWYAKNYEHLKEKGVKMVVSPSYLPLDRENDNYWKGYPDGFLPVDLEVNDIGKIKEQQAWLKYALPGKLEISGAEYGTTTYLKGKLWNLELDGTPLITQRNTTKVADSLEKYGSLVNLWF